jgi:hypothetical protein
MMEYAKIDILKKRNGRDAHQVFVHINFILFYFSIIYFIRHEYAYLKPSSTTHKTNSPKPKLMSTSLERPKKNRERPCLNK